MQSLHPVTLAALLIHGQHENNVMRNMTLECSEEVQLPCQLLFDIPSGDPTMKICHCEHYRIAFKEPHCLLGVAYSSWDFTTYTQREDDGRGFQCLNGPDAMRSANFDKELLWSS